VFLTVPVTPQFVIVVAPETLPIKPPVEGYLELAVDVTSASTTTFSITAPDPVSLNNPALPLVTFSLRVTVCPSPSKVPRKLEVYGLMTSISFVSL